VAGVFDDTATGLGQIIPNLNIGVSWAPVDTGSFSLAINADYRYLIPLWGLDSGRSFLDNIGAGVRLGFGRLFTLSAGLSEMTPCVGLGFRIELTHIDITFYGAEQDPSRMDDPMYHLELGVRVER
jgi:hypothetical protein